MPQLGKDKELRLVEHYSSIEGEGPRTGVPTQFVRFAGCNLRCPGWPCDTDYAIEPSLWARNHFKKQPMQLVEDCDRLANESGARNIALTGGEPFIQDATALRILGECLLIDFLVEVFTNGTVMLPDWALKWTQINLDWKLKGSGEVFDGSNAKDYYRHRNAYYMKEDDMIKFVCKDRADFEEGVRVAEMIHREARPQLWFGVVWNSNYSTAMLTQDMLHHPELPLKLNVQVHKYIWPLAKKGV